MAIIKEQPAIKSYFFGKGYRDLANTIKDSWLMNIDSMVDYWDKTKKFWNKGNIFMAATIATVFAAISVVIFGTLWFVTLSIFHIVFLGLLFLLIYISFTILWLIERMYMTYRRIFVVCPTPNCHSKSDLPYFRCPNCKRVHTRLTPSSYGILKRICLCGEKLPTSFLNGRNRLESLCPNCSRDLSDVDKTPICIPIIGGPSVGKTCFLFAAVKEFVESHAPLRSWKTRFPNIQNEKDFNKIKASFNKGIVPQKTTEKDAAAFNFLIDSVDWSPEKFIYIYDSAGEAFFGTENLFTHRFYSFLHGFLFIIDPFSIPELIYEYEDNLKLYNQEIKPSNLMLEDCFETVMLHLHKNHKIKFDQQIKKPCAIVINKIDAFDLEDRIGENAARQLLISRPELGSLDEAVNQLCETLFIQWNLGNFLQKLKSKFKTYRFFTCSALGHMPDESNKPFRPYRVIDPLMWILEKADKDLRKDDQGIS